MEPGLKKTLHFMEAEELGLWLSRILGSTSAFHGIRPRAPRAVLVSHGQAKGDVECTDYRCDIVNLGQNATVVASVTFSSQVILIIDHEGNRAIDIPRGSNHSVSKARTYGEIARLLGFDPVQPVLHQIFGSGTS